MPAPPAELLLRVDPATARAYRDAAADVKARARAAFERALHEEQEATERATESAPSLLAILAEPGERARSKAEIDRDLRALREEWDR